MRMRYADTMATLRGRTKFARLMVNLDRPTYASLVEVAKREDVSVSWVVRYAIEALLERDGTTAVGPALASTMDQGNRISFGDIAPQ